MKNFDEIYKTMSTISTEKLDIAKKEFFNKALKTVIIEAILLVIIDILLFIKNRSDFLTLFLFFFMISLIIFIILIIMYLQKVIKIYKEEIITKFVSAYDENLQFDSTAHMEKIDYMLAEFERFDNFYSNDLIYGKIDGIIDFKLGDVRTEYVDYDSDGHTTRTTLFRGLFSVAKLDKNINATIKIRLDNPFRLSNKNMLTMDSQEFEKYFDIYCTDKLLTMRILTSDIMDYMLDFAKKNKFKFEIILKESQIYVRINSDDMFEVPSRNYKILHKYYTYINFMCELNKKIYNVISSKDI